MNCLMLMQIVLHFLMTFVSQACLAAQIYHVLQLPEHD